MTFQETITLARAGYSKAEIEALAAQAASAQVQPQAPAPQVQVGAASQEALAQAQPQAVQPTAQPNPQNLVEALTLAQQLEQIGALLQQSSQPVPPAPTQNVTNQPALTPANAGITPDEATKLFQAWSMGNASQTVELPPTADDVLAKRFNSLYGVDTTQTNKIGG